MVGVPKRSKEEIHYIVGLYFQRRSVSEIRDVCIQRWPQRKAAFAEPKLKYVCNHYGKNPEFIPKDADGNPMPLPSKRRPRTPNRRPSQSNPPANPQPNPLQPTPKRGNLSGRKVNQKPGNLTYSSGGSLHESSQLARSSVSPGPNALHMNNGRFDSMSTGHSNQYPPGRRPRNPPHHTTKSSSNGQASPSPSGYQRQNPIFYGNTSQVLASPHAARSNRAYSGFNSSAARGKHGNSVNPGLDASQSSGMQSQIHSLGYRQYGQPIEPQRHGGMYEDNVPLERPRNNLDQVHRNNVHQAQPQGVQGVLDIITYRKNAHGFYDAYDAQGYEIPFDVAQELTGSYRGSAQRLFANVNRAGSPSPYQRQRLQAGNASSHLPPVLGSYDAQRGNSADVTIDIEDFKARNPKIDPQLLGLQYTENAQGEQNNRSNRGLNISTGQTMTKEYPVLPNVPDVCNYIWSPLQQPQITSTNAEPILYSQGNRVPSHRNFTSAALENNTAATISAPGMFCPDGREGIRLATLRDTPEKFGRSERATGIKGGESGDSRDLSYTFQSGEKNRFREMRVLEGSKSSSGLQPHPLPSTFQGNDNASELSNLNTASPAGNPHRTNINIVSKFSPQDPTTQPNESLKNLFGECAEENKVTDIRAYTSIPETLNFEIPNSGITLPEGSSVSVRSTELPPLAATQKTKPVVTTQPPPQLLDSHKAHNRAIKRPMESSQAEEPNPKRVSPNKAEEVPKSSSPTKRPPIYFNMSPRSATMPLTLPAPPLLEGPLLHPIPEAQKVDHKESTAVTSDAPAEDGDNEQTQSNDISLVSDAVDDGSSTEIDESINLHPYDSSSQDDNEISQEDEDLLREFFETGDDPLGYTPSSPESNNIMAAFLSPEEEAEATYQEALAYVEERTGISQAELLAGDPALAGNLDAPAVGQQLASYGSWLAQDHGPHYSPVWTQEWFDSLDAVTRKKFCDQFPLLADNSSSTPEASITRILQGSEIASNQFMAQDSVQQASSSSAATVSGVWAPQNNTAAPESQVFDFFTGQGTSSSATATASNDRIPQIDNSLTPSASYTGAPQTSNSAPITELDDEFSEFIDYSGGADFVNGRIFEWDPDPNHVQGFTDEELQAPTPVPDTQWDPNGPVDKIRDEAVKPREENLEDLFQSPKHSRDD
ncbi:hypothetical protein B7494_g5080 [Chlorociboria aeruginascens]|nr:hypothetical protein B7494_g5080 [Chlorociboria aeruginascens]